MTNHLAFDNHTEAYEQWHIEHPFEYQSELEALRQIIGEFKNGLEIGVGTGRFAGPLKIGTGIDPSPKMLNLASKRGVKVIEACAEDIPFEDEIFDLVVFVTTVCFLSDVEKAFLEARRVLKSEGEIVIGFIDANSILGDLYQSKKEESTFYKNANFHSADEMITKLKKAGFPSVLSWQTLFRQDPRRVEPTIQGHGRGSFVVLKSTKP